MNNNNDKPQTIIDLNFAPYSLTTTEMVHPDGSKTVTTTRTISELRVPPKVAAQLLGVSERTLDLLCDLGRVRQHYAGAQRGFLVPELLEDAARLPQFPDNASLADQLKLLLAQAA